MKIGFDAREVFGSPAGKGQVAKKLLEGLARLDTQNEYVVFVDSKEALQLPANFQIQFVAARSLFWHLAVARMLPKLGVDLYLSPTSYIVPAITAVPTVPIIHDLIAFLRITAHQEKATLVERLTLSRAVKRAAALACVSKSTETDLTRLFPEASGKTRVIYSGSPVEPYFIAATKDTPEKFLELHLPETYILYVGTLEPRKNVEGIVAAYAAYRERVKDPLPLVLVGKPGWHYKSIYAAVEKFDLLSSVIFAGYVANEFMPYLYQHAACLFFPSFYEGFGIPPLEALMNDCPVITSHVSSLPEVTGDAALYVDPANTEEMARALTSVLTDSSIRTKLIEAGRIQRTKFSWDTCAQSFLSLMQDAATSKK